MNNIAKINDCCAVFHSRVIRKNVSPKCIELCTNMAAVK